MGPARFSNHQRAIQKHLPRRHLRPIYPFEHDTKGRFADIPAGLMNRGEWHRQERGIVHIVHADDTDFLWNLNSLRQKIMHQMSRYPVIRTDETFTLQRCRR